MKKVKVIVASTNPVKVKATKVGFERMFPRKRFEISGVSAPSGVSDQPVSEEEILKGAINRTENVSRFVPDADFWVGIEGGSEEMDGQLISFAWVVIKSKAGIVGKSRTGSFFLPKKVVELIRKGKELGEADDIVFGTTNSKQINGAVGILTGDVVTRTDLYEEAVILALIPFRNKGFY